MTFPSCNSPWPSPNRPTADRAGAALKGPAALQQGVSRPPTDNVFADAGLCPVRGASYRAPCPQESHNRKVD